MTWNKCSASLTVSFKTNRSSIAGKNIQPRYAVNELLYQSANYMNHYIIETYLNLILVHCSWAKLFIEFYSEATRWPTQQLFLTSSVGAAEVFFLRVQSAAHACDCLCHTKWWTLIVISWLYALILSRKQTKWLSSAACYTLTSTATTRPMAVVKTINRHSTRGLVRVNMSRKSSRKSYQQKSSMSGLVFVH